ncbi:double-strand break repair protein mre11 [Holotrichia oblita]|uniref:Double-strand break repair protein mre11 n=1 Tax=Holotrichia oblita TaxID=644536 RepID=A0ACB9TGD4_HOLOL|nr:double-strand break repair protein mre11 [Holotrichia oblita]
MAKEILDDNVFKILIATDNHLGYGESKPNIAQDSFRAFEEILQLAIKNEVDMMLLGGNLFHENQPSSYSFQKCTQLLKKYCLGDKAIAIEFLSDQKEHFSHLENPIVNYEDPNLNISLPIFAIHGSHETPSGSKFVSALDALSSTGFINYFGRYNDLSEIEIKPILLKKGDTKIAIYGLSHVPDQRLVRLFQEKKVKMPRVDDNDWFNILVLHQNRANRGAKNFIPYDIIPDFIDLVIWGHEHDCNIKPTQYTQGGPHIIQPGSSVATSLSEGEATEKHVGLLKVYKGTFKIIPLPLKSVRPFIYEDIVLCKPGTDEYDLQSPKKQAISDVKAKLEEMIQKATIKKEDNNTPFKPLIRLSVKYYTEVQIFNGIRLGYQYENRVANPGEMFKFSNFNPKDRRKRTDGVWPVSNSEFNDVDDWATSVEDVVEKYFKNYERSTKMKVLSVKLMTQAVSRSVDHNDYHSLAVACKAQINKTVKLLEEKNADCDDIDNILDIIKQERIKDEDKEVIELAKEFEKERTVGTPTDIDEYRISDDEVEVVRASVDKPVRGRGSRGGRGGTKRPRRSRGRGGQAR